MQRVSIPAAAASGRSLSSCGFSTSREPSIDRKRSANRPDPPSGGTVHGMDADKSFYNRLPGTGEDTKVKAIQFSSSYALIFCLSVATLPPARADVAPGDVIDATNWQKAKELLPEPVLNWVKKGDFVLNVDELRFRLLDFFPPFQIEAFQTHVGKYELDADGGIIDAHTGKPTEQIIGLPFPAIAPDDPRLPEKLMQNNHYMQYMPGNLRFPFQGLYLARSGFERESGSLWMQMAMDGHPGVLQVPNPRGIEKYAIMVVKTPYDLAGTAIMLWRYRDPNKQDNSFGYLPAIRRVRRMSPANRSDALLGGDFAIDDANGYDGKVTAFTWKSLRRQEALLPMLDVDPVRIVRNESAEWETTQGIKPVVYGYQKQGWQGAAWAPTNLCWIKRPVHVLEMIPKDPYYNYGPQHLWLDAEIYGCGYKVIYDKSGKYWKTLFLSAAACQSDDKSMRFLSLSSQQVIDDRSDRSSVIEDCSPRNIWAFFAKMDENNFSLAGFQRFCK